MSQFSTINLSNQRFGRLTAISHVPDSSRESRWTCVCDCGNLRTVLQGSLTQGKTASCGCLGREKRLLSHITHGYAKSPTYVSWQNMRARCGNSKLAGYKNYGGRGIRVCKRWNSFICFLQDMGIRPDGLTLERRDVNGCYTPSNCYWASKYVQANNTRANIRVDGSSLADACRNRGIGYSAVYQRVRVLGYSAMEALAGTRRAAGRSSRHAQQAIGEVA